jgi:Raf kinase inhibitor-like YbhB/YbcL family protein
MDFTLESTAFAQGGEIPVRHTCDGSDTSPPLAWRGVPDGTRGLAIVVDDPDAPDPAAPRMVWVHWVVVDLPPDLAGLPDGASGRLPAPAVEGWNDWKGRGWRGPCPPIGLWPELEWIRIRELREAVPPHLGQALEESPLTPEDLETIPFTLLVPTARPRSWSTSAAWCTSRGAPRRRCSEFLGMRCHRHGRGDRRRDPGRCRQAAGVREGGRPGPAERAGRLLRHPFTGSRWRWRVRRARRGLPRDRGPRRRGRPGPRTTEAIIVHHADFMSYLPFRKLASSCHHAKAEARHVSRSRPDGAVGGDLEYERPLRARRCRPRGQALPARLARLRARRLPAGGREDRARGARRDRGPARHGDRQRREAGRRSRHRWPTR